MNINIYPWLTFFVTMSLCASCSVKEDRSECPCLLTLDFSHTDTTDITSVRILVSDNGGPVFDEEVAPSSFMPEYTVAVPQTSSFLNVYSGGGEMVGRDGCIVIPPGKECPKVYSFGCELLQDQEAARESVDFRKDHCVMTIHMNGQDGTGYMLRITGNINGYGRDGSLCKGDFFYVPEHKGDGIFEVTVPRQEDSSLMLEIDDGTEVLKNFALGEYVAAGGYDWKASYLEDISVYIDWSMTTITCTVQGWDWIYKYEIVI